MLLRCVARLGLRPPRSWQLALDDALQPSLLQLSLRELLPTLQALVALQLVPSPELVAAAEQCCSSMAVAATERPLGWRQQHQRAEFVAAGSEAIGSERSSSSSSSSKGRRGLRQQGQQKLKASALSEQQQLTLCHLLVERLRAAATEGRYPREQQQQLPGVDSSPTSPSRRRIDRWMTTAAGISSSRDRLPGGAPEPRGHRGQRGADRDTNVGRVKGNGSGWAATPHSSQESSSSSSSREGVKECVAAAAQPQAATATAAAC